MIFYDADIPSPNPLAVRLFARERGGLKFEGKVIDLTNLENRAKAYRETVNPRGELPALRLDDGRVLTENLAICEYFDEIAVGGRSMIGDSAEERAFTRSWTRWADLEIAQPTSNWFRGTDMAVDFYRGNRVLFRDGQFEQRTIADRGLNALDDHLDGRDFICASDRPMMADVLLYAFVGTIQAVGPWINAPGRRNVAAWTKRMSERPATLAAMESFNGPVSL